MKLPTPAEIVRSSTDRWRLERKPCPSCAGTGEETAVEQIGDASCSACQGSGDLVELEEAISRAMAEAIRDALRVEATGFVEGNQFIVSDALLDAAASIDEVLNQKESAT